MERNIKVYHYKRGEDFQCHIRILEDGLVIFEKFKYPTNSSNELIEKLMDDAEKEALKLFDEKKYANNS